MTPCRCWIAAASFVVVSAALADDHLPLRVHRLPNTSLARGESAAAPFLPPSAADMADILAKELTRKALFVVDGAPPVKATSQGRTATHDGGPHRLGSGT